MIKFDNIIIGAGPGGYELAAALSHRGESVAIIEREYLGGTCLNRGCIPTKTLCASANAILNASFASNLGVNIDSVKVDYSFINNRIGKVVEGLRDGIASLLNKCEVIQGEASLVSSNQVKVNEQTYQADRIVIASGSRPASLPIPGVEYAITSDEALWLTELPESVAIIGGGVIGIEFASIYNALGVNVTVIEFCKEILPPVDPEIAKRLRTSLSRRGIYIITGSAVKSIEKLPETMRIHYQGKKGEAFVDAKTTIMAVGRRPVVPDGFVENGGRLNEKGFISVDEYMRTSIENVYAIGDVNGLLMLAHAAYAQGNVILHKNPGLFDTSKIPSVVFSSPEVATVGPTPSQLEEAGIKVHAVKRPFASNGKANADGHPDGLLKMLVRDDDNTVAAVSIIGHHAEALLAEATIIVTSRMTPEDISLKYVHAHPTLSEIFIVN